MLRELSIKNFAIIDDLSLSLDKGLTILTGETGAGKSILIKAVDLILGARAAADLIRTGKDTAELAALFEVPAGSAAAEAALDLGFDPADGLLIRRIIHKSGRHRVYINDRPATTQALSAINGHLASIAGQHSHQALLKPAYHLLVLDRFGGLEGLRDAVSACYEKLLPLIRELDALNRQMEKQTEHIELLSFQAEEIRRARVECGEDDTLEQERERLRHAERLYATVGRCVESLYGIEGAVAERLAGIGKEIQGLCRIDEALSPLAQRLEGAALEVEDVANELQAYLQGIVFDTERLDEVEQRLNVLEKLKRKYGGSLEAVIAYAQETEGQLERVSRLPEAIERTRVEIGACRKELISLCRKLSRKRRKAAGRLSDKVVQEAASLGMPAIRFDVSFSRIPADEHTDPYLIVDKEGVDATGMDRVAFLISPNVGEDLRPLARIASGGELSRMILALKAILATGDAVETLIFDEVDAGIGGGIAEMVGRKLAALARYHQVICITHLPQIARFGSRHFKIEKSVHRGRTRTTIIPVDGEARIRELARMLGGVRITKQSLAHAREMMRQKA
ncbi:MAG: DNA repair protein RecN [Deltaproteobacteria bacterium]|nr:DNA repair protein RecN [Deltaproteobacteria bacterium]